MRNNKCLICLLKQHESESHFYLAKNMPRQARLSRSYCDNILNRVKKSKLLRTVHLCENPEHKAIALELRSEIKNLIRNDIKRAELKLQNAELLYTESLEQLGEAILKYGPDSIQAHRFKIRLKRYSLVKAQRERRLRELIERAS